MANVFFQATQDALDNVTSTFDFVHPLHASMKYTRRKVLEIYTGNPAAANTLFRAEVDPNGEIHGVNYRDAFIITPWSHQKEQLAWLLLNNLFAIHEG